VCALEIRLHVLGGDEFTILLENIQSLEDAQVAERIQQEPTLPLLLVNTSVYQYWHCPEYNRITNPKTCCVTLTLQCIAPKRKVRCDII